MRMHYGSGPTTADRLLRLDQPPEEIIMSSLRRIRGVLLPALAILTIGLAGCAGADERKARYLEKAEAFLAQSDLEKAQLELRNALQIDPNFAKAQLMLADVSEKLGDPRKALQLYQSVLDQDAGNLAARAGLARIYLFGGLTEKAMELVAPGLAQAPDTPELLAIRGAAKARLGDATGAVADAERALAIDPKNESAAALVAALYMQQNRVDDARKKLEAATAAVPKSVDLRLILADIYARSGETERAEQTLLEIVRLQPDKIAHRQSLARFYMAHKRVDDAEKALRKAVEIAPDNLDARKTLVDFVAAQRSVEAGIALLQEYEKADPKNLDLKLSIGDFYAARGRAEEAKSAYDRVVELGKDKPQALVARNRLAAYEVSQKNFDEARRLIGEVLAANPQDNDALALRAQIALDKGDPAAAVADLRAVLRDQPVSVPVQRALASAYLQSKDVALAEETLRKAIETNPADPDLRVDLAQVLVSSGRADRALEELRKTVDEYPQNVAAQEHLFLMYAQKNDTASARAIALSVKSARPDLGIGDYLLGLVELADGKNAAAVAALQASLKLQPTAAEPLTALVKAHLQQKDPAAAIELLQATARTQPKNAHARNLLGEVLLAQKQGTAALAAFDEAIALAPAWWMPYRGKALAQLAAQQPDAAMQTMQKGLEATSGAVPLGVDLAALKEKFGKPEDAIRVYEGLLERSPTNAALANNLAMLLVTYRKDAASMERARQLVEPLKSSKDPAIINTVGWVSYKLGRYQEALPLLQQASDAMPESPLMRFHLGMAQLKAGQPDAARKNLERALQAGQQFPGADDAKAALEQLRRS
jgi:tetratricopeptide (TPR) repeat protein